MVSKLGLECEVVAVVVVVNHTLIGQEYSG